MPSKSDSDSDTDQRLTIGDAGASSNTCVDKNYLLLLALKLKDKMTAEATEDVAKLTNFISGSNRVASTKHMFNKMFENIPANCELHYICKNCNS